MFVDLSGVWMHPITFGSPSAVISINLRGSFGCFMGVGGKRSGFWFFCRVAFAGLAAVIFIDRLGSPCFFFRLTFGGLKFRFSHRKTFGFVRLVFYLAFGSVWVYCFV